MTASTYKQLIHRRLSFRWGLRRQLNYINESWLNASRSLSVMDEFYFQVNWATVSLSLKLLKVVSSFSNQVLNFLDGSGWIYFRFNEKPHSVLYCKTFVVSGMLLNVYCRICNFQISWIELCNTFHLTRSIYIQKAFTYKWEKNKALFLTNSSARAARLIELLRPQRLNAKEFYTQVFHK